MNYPIGTIKIIIAELINFGVIDKNLQAGVLSKIWTETAFIPKVETGYAKTPNAQVRKIFGKRVESYNEDDLIRLKSNDVSFFNVVYGGMYGNGKDEGYKFRGRFFNQLTFKDNYTKYGKLIKTDMTTNPDQFNNDLVIASEISAVFFSDNLKTHGIVKADSLQDAAKIMMRINAGWGTDITTLFYQALLTKQLAAIKDLYSLI